MFIEWICNYLQSNTIYYISACLRLGLPSLAKNPKQICGQLVGRTINLRKREIEQKINNNDSSKSDNEYEINQLINNIFQFKDYEWYYAVNDGLTQADDPCIMVLSGHSSYVNSVCYSPDGKTLASGSNDKTVRIWDVMSGECVHVLNGHSDSVRSVR